MRPHQKVEMLFAYLKAIPQVGQAMTTWTMRCK